MEEIRVLIVNMIAQCEFSEKRVSASRVDALERLETIVKIVHVVLEHVEQVDAKRGVRALTCLFAAVIGRGWGHLRLEQNFGLATAVGTRWRDAADDVRRGLGRGLIYSL